MTARGDGILRSEDTSPSANPGAGEDIRRVLLIGGAGYVGSVLARHLLDHGYEVTVMDALVYGDEGVRELYARPGFDVLRADQRDLEALVRGARDADAIVHLGGLVGDPSCALDEQLTRSINVESTLTIANVARGLGVKRFVFASTCAVYGSGHGVLDEDSPLGPISVYAKTKMESERLLLGLEGDGFAPIILRFGTFYGLSPRPRFDLVVNLLAAKALSEGEITIFGGKQWRPFIHVADGAEVVRRCLEAPLDRVRGQVFNVGADDQNYTLRQIAELITEQVPSVRVVYRKEEGEEPNYHVSFAKLRRELDFVPTHSVAQGIFEIGRAILKGTISNWDATRYSNHKTLLSGDAVEILKRSDPVEAALLEMDSGARA